MEEPNPSPDHHHSIDTAEPGTLPGELCNRVFRSSPEAITVSRIEDGVFLEANESFERMSGYRRDEVIGRSSLDLSLWTEAPEDRAALAQELRAKGSVRDFPVSLKTRRGDIVHCLMSAETLEYDGQLCAVVVTRDVTESERIQQALRDSEERYRTLFDSATDAVFLMDDDRFIDCNEATFAMFGRTREEIIGNKPYDTHLSPIRQADGVPSVDKAREKIAGVLAGKPQRFEWRHLRSDGTPFDAEVSLNRLETGGKSFVLAICRDISERKRAEKALQHSEEQYRSIFEITTNGLSLRKLDGTLVAVNPAMAAMYGYTREEYMRLSLADLMPEEMLPVFKEFQKTVADGEIFHREAKARHKDGRVFDLEIYGVQFQFHGEPHTLTISRDISARKSAEEALRASEEQYRSLVTNIPCAVWTSDSEGRTKFISPNVEAVDGYTQEEHCQGDAHFWLRRIHPEDLSRVKAAIEAFVERDAPYDIEYRVRTKSGELIWLNDRATRTYDDQGVMRVDGVFSDITARKEAEAARQRVEQQYHHVFESVVDGLAILNMEGRFVDVNRALCELHGVSREEHLSLTPVAFLDPDDIPEFRASMENARMGESFHRDARAKSRDGRILDLDIRGTTFEYCGKPHVLSVIRDITESKQTESRLRQVTEQLVDANAALEEKNAALRQILEHLEQDKRAYRHEVCESVEKLLLPVVARLKESGGRLDAADIGLLETTLTAILERDIDQFRSNLARLTPRELDICELIKAGCSSKDIAARLNISSQTVHKHRQLIRRKLQLSNKAVNLAAYLRSR